MVPDGPAALISALEVDLEYVVPVLVREFGEDAVFDDASVIYEDVHTAKAAQGSVNNLAALSDIVVVRDGLAAVLGDGSNDLGEGRNTWSTKR